MVKDENGKKVQITEKEVIYWSKSYYEKQKHENKSFLDFIDKLKSNPESFRITKTQVSSLKKFIKKEFVNELTGEVIDSNKLKAIIDEDLALIIKSFDINIPKKLYRRSELKDIKMNIKICK